MGFFDPKQEWEADFGSSYLERNNLTLDELNNLYLSNYGISRSTLNEEFIGDLPRTSRVLELGCNIGNQLKLLQRMGFIDLWGLDISEEAIDIARKNSKNLNIVKSSALETPFKNNFFDLVYTSGVLIHINPKNLEAALDNMYNLSRKYIWCFEYYSETECEVEYRGKTGLLWKNNFMSLFMNRFPELKILKEKKIQYLNNNNIDHMFLLLKG